ncbi:hypothetical protein KI387_044130 [Taxus chinensis]|uniref:Reverse transcriptase Ty1/copia-type domain-containing protein n=1 Tax=Taxus chinensis TaxID=29808 RepID=A0AA38C145_TAXCH|nr:hypothetical protein KI387_044130 [Taxus chinensis]
MQVDASKKWEQAMDEEHKSLMENQTWDLVNLPEGKIALQNKCVYKVKDEEGGKKIYKARLVVKGFTQKQGIEFDEIFSPVVKMTSIRTVLEIVAAEDLHLEQLDVKTVFVHGDLEEELYMQQPEGYEVKGKEEMVCKRKKSLYGLKQAPCQWYKKFDSFMMEQGKNMQEIKVLKKQLSESFDMKDLGAARQILGHFKLSKEQCPMTEQERNHMSKVPYSSVVGSLMYAMVCTRPDITHAMGAVSRFMSDPGKEHWQAVKWILRYLRGTMGTVLCYNGSDTTLRGYVDSDMAGDVDSRRSTTGYIYTVGGTAVSWISRL